MSERIDIIEELHNLLDRRPFRAFTIVMNGGQRYDVTGKHQVAVGRTVVILLGPDSPSIHMRADGISSLEDPQPVGNT